MSDPLNRRLFFGSLILGAFLWPPACAQGPRYTVTNISSLTQLKFVPADINVRGQIVGRVVYDPQWRSDTYLACLLDEQNQPVKLGTLEGKKDSAAKAINYQGLVAGESGSLDYAAHGFVWSGTSGIRDIGSLGGDMTYVWGMNNKGYVIGESKTEDGDLHAYLWSDETGMTDLGDLGLDSFDLTGITEYNQVVGNWHRDEINQMAFIWDEDRGRTDLGTLGGKTTFAGHVNNRGQIVGLSKTKSCGLFGGHAFIWDATGGMRDLGSLGGDYSAAASINYRGQIVGTSLVRGGYGVGRAILDFMMERDSSEKRKHAFLWEEGKMIDLNDLIPKDSAWILRRAKKITDSGLILGIGEFKGKEAYFLLSPVK